MSKVFYTIERQDLLDLIENSLKYQALEFGGVDNWSWYSDSLKHWLDFNKIEGLKIDEDCDMFRVHAEWELENSVLYHKIAV